MNGSPPPTTTNGNKVKTYIVPHHVRAQDKMSPEAIGNSSKIAAHIDSGVSKYWHFRFLPNILVSNFTFPATNDTWPKIGIADAGLITAH